ncbi:MAG: right-handed parallel beta-helix repeat-containing protein [Labilithrix sp.]|nr:right-handed parallel beta-helix repeat-containing protein [Labilithrix sp.]
MSPWRIALLVCALAAGCAGSEGGDGTGPGGSAPDGGDGCSEGFRRGADGACVPLVFDGECPAGTRPVLGHAECQPVGWQECPAGFERDPSGWGCAAVLPRAACSGATREALGQTACVPLGDCAAAFPPAGARLFVSASGPVDATHFRRIGDAIRASRAGDVIAVDDGAYAETLEITKDVTIRGRCAERVRLDGGDRATTPGIVAGAAAATVRGVAIVGFSTGASVERGTITFEDVLFEHESDLGVAVYDGATAKLVRSVVRDTYPRASASGIGVQAIFGARVEIVDSVVAKNQGGGALVGEPESSVLVDGSVFRDNESDLNGTFGLGLNVTSSATGKVTRSAFIANRRAGLRAGPKTKLEIEDTVVLGTRAEKSGSVGMGFFALDGATVTAKRFSVSASEGPAITVLLGAKAKVEQATLRSMVGDTDGDLANGAYVFDKGKLELIDTAIVDAGRSGVDAFGKGTSLALERSLVTGTRPSYGTKMGVGVNVATGAAATITDSSIVANLHSGIYLWEGAAVDLAGVLVRGTKKELFEDRLGHGLLAQDAPHVTVERSAFDANVGIGLALAGSPALIKSSFVRSNSVGIHVQGTTLREATDASEVADGEVVVTADTTFLDNATKVGSGVLALPEPPTTKKP